MTSKRFALICRMLILSVMMCSFQSAKAGMIGTDRVSGVSSTITERAHIGSLLARDDVSRQLQALGVDVKSA